MPRSHRSSNETAPLLRAPSSPPKDANGHRPNLKAGDICVGCIVWLPPKDANEGVFKCRKDGCCQHSELEEAGYNHPVVVLDIKQRKGSKIVEDLVCVIACITTFKDMSLSKYLARRKRIAHFQTSIPIRDSNSIGAEAMDIKSLALERGNNLRKQSYVKTDHAYMIPAGALRTYGFQRKECRAYKLRLDVHSYTLLMTEIQMTPSPYAETNTLFETAAVRLVVLAGSSKSVVASKPRVQLPIQQPDYHSSYLGTPQNSRSPQVARSMSYQPPVYTQVARPMSYQPPVYTPHTLSTPTEEPSAPSYWSYVVGFVIVIVVMILIVTHTWQPLGY